MKLGNFNVKFNSWHETFVKTWRADRKLRKDIALSVLQKSLKNILYQLKVT